MTYEPTHWQDRIVEKPRTYHVQNNPDGTITLIPAPGTVIQEGTPVNAANLNKLEQGLVTLPDSIYRIGDIKTTARTDLGEKWLLCNGDAISKESYPDLYALLGLFGAWTANSQGSTHLYGITYGNGYWVTVGRSGTLYYKADTPVGAWAANNQASTNLRGVTYGNGYWVAVGESGTLLYKADTPVGAWTANKQGSNNLYGITYGNGYWVAVGDYGTLLYKADTPVGAWAANNQGSTNLLGVAYGNGYWVAVGESGTLYYKVITLPTITLDGAYVYIRAK